MEYVNLERVLIQMANEFVAVAKGKLDEKRTFTTPKVRWTKAGKGWRGKKIGTRQRTGKINASKRLSDSLGFTIEYQNGMPFIMIESLDYAIYVNDGRKPGKYAPPKKITRWITWKGIRLRDMKTGKFIKQTAQGYRSLQFLINRKIKYFGIEPTHFLDESIDAVYSIYEEKLAQAVIEDFKANLE